MKRIDVVILAALVVAAAGSALGVVTYEDGRGVQFRVTWATTEETVQAEQASLTGNGEAEVALPVPLRNLTGGEVAVAVGSAPGALAPIAVRIEITVPGLAEPIVSEEELPTASQGATFTVPVELGAAPNETTVRATSADDAAARLAGTSASGVGFGNWTVKVSLATTVPDPLGAVSHTIDVSATLQSYRPEAVPLTPEAGR